MDDGIEAQTAAPFCVRRARQKFSAHFLRSLVISPTVGRDVIIGLRGGRILLGFRNPPGVFGRILGGGVPARGLGGINIGGVPAGSLGTNYPSYLGCQGV